MVPADTACVQGSTNGTNGIPMSFMVLPMVLLIKPLVPMVMPMVPLALPMVPLVPLVNPEQSQGHKHFCCCRLHYFNTLKQELKGTKAYEETSIDEKSAVNSHLNELPLKFSVICVKERQDKLKPSGIILTKCLWSRCFMLYLYSFVVY